MYKKILLAYDGSIEGRAALREGALLAQTCGAEVHILAVAGHPALTMAEGAYAGPCGSHKQELISILAEALERLNRLGLKASGALVDGDPAREICQAAQSIRADLVVVGHRKTTLLERWWAGSAGAYLSDYISCTLLVSRTNISDAEFSNLLETTARAVPEFNHP